MRKKAAVWIEDEKEVLTEIHNMVKDDANSIYFSEDLLQVSIYEDKPSYGVLMEELYKKGIDYSFAESREYSKDEFKQAEFFNMVIIYPWESDGTTADEYGTQYDESTACPGCGIGKKQISDLIIDKRKVGKHDIVTITPEIIVNYKLYELIICNNLTGFEFKPVKDKKGKEEPILHQLYITSILPKMNDRIKTEIEYTTYCDKCKMHGVILRSEMIYDKSSLNEAKDFNLSYEYFGIRMYCNRQVIVSKKAHELFIRNKVKKVAFEPISIL